MDSCLIRRAFGFEPEEYISSSPSQGTFDKQTSRTTTCKEYRRGRKRAEKPKAIHLPVPLPYKRTKVDKGELKL